MEQWRAIPDFPGYEASDQGRVRSYYKRTLTKGQHGMSWHLAETPQRIMAGATAEGPYKRRMVLLMRNGKPCGRSIHRLVLLAFHGPPLPGFECAHNNSDPLDNRLSNLRYDTKWGNAQDRRLRDGEPPEVWVPRLRKERAEGASLKELAAKYHYSTKSIWSICRGLMYAKCGGPLAQKRSLKLTDNDIIEIKRRIGDGEVQRRLAEEYGVHESTISYIKTGTYCRTVPKL